MSTGDLESNMAGLIDALQNGSQADMDGTFVTVSRQACEMAAEILSSGSFYQEKDIDKLQDRIRDLEAFVANVRDWNLPPSGVFYTNGEPAPYDSFLYRGSQGAKDYWRTEATKLVPIK